MQFKLQLLYEVMVAQILLDNCVYASPRPGTETDKSAGAGRKIDLDGSPKGSMMDTPWTSPGPPCEEGQTRLSESSPCVGLVWSRQAGRASHQPASARDPLGKEALRAARFVLDSRGCLPGSLRAI